MKMIVAVALALVVVAAALPVQEEPEAIVRSDFQQNPEGGFAYAYETAKGTNVEAVGELKTVTDEENKPREVVVIRGQYTYIDTDGKPNTVNYVADELGYRAEGASIPKSN